MKLLHILKNILLDIIDDINEGTSSIDDDAQLEEIINAVRKYTRKDIALSKYQAHTYLGIGRATFDKLVNAGKLPKGQKVAGFNELRWYKKDLDKCIKNK